MEKKIYHTPCLEEVILLTEQAMGPSFPELPDHDWVKNAGIEVFPEES